MTSYRDVRTVHAEIADLSGRQMEQAGGVGLEATTQIRIRFPGTVFDKTWRVKHGSRLYEVVHIGRDHTLKREWTLLCREAA